MASAGVATVLALGIGPSLGAVPHRPAAPLRRTAPDRTLDVTSRLPGLVDPELVSDPDGQLLLTGGLAATFGASDGNCGSAAVDQHTLAVAPVQDASCDDPAVFGQSVGIVESGPSPSTVSIARAGASPGEFTVGPVVMTYGLASNTRVVTAYGGGWLWVYDVASTNGPELLQVSEATGQVVDTVEMPEPLYRPEMVADAAGLWIGNSSAGADEPDTLYFVAPGASAPSLAVPGNFDVYWMTSAGDTVFAGIGGYTTHGYESLYRYDGSDTVPSLELPIGFSLNILVARPGKLLWNVSATSNDHIELERVDPASGKEFGVATLPAGAENLQMQALIEHRSLFVLEPATYGGTLLRVTLPG